MILGLPVRISSYDGSKVSVIGLGVMQILGALIVADGDVLVASVLVLDIEVGQGRAVGDERSVDALGREVVLLERVAREGREW